MSKPPYATGGSARSSDAPASTSDPISLAFEMMKPTGIAALAELAGSGLFETVQAVTPGIEALSEIGAKFEAAGPTFAELSLFAKVPDLGIDTASIASLYAKVDEGFAGIAALAAETPSFGSLFAKANEGFAGIAALAAETPSFTKLFEDFHAATPTFQTLAIEMAEQAAERTAGLAGLASASNLFEKLAEDQKPMDAAFEAIIGATLKK